MDELNQIFSAVCGQETAHTWAPGGMPLPFCQRCTGLYTGALAAALLHLICSPHPSARFLKTHGVFLLVMIPFGYHWLPQGPELRCITGVLFAFGLFTFLQLPLRRVDSPGPAGARQWFYYGGLLLSVATVPFLAVCGGDWDRNLLTLAGSGGAITLALLVLSNIGRAFLVAERSLRRLTKRNADA